MKTEVIYGTNITEEGQSEADVIVVPEFVWEFRDLNLRKVGEDDNGMISMLDRLYSDHIAFKVDGAMADDIVSCSRSVECEAGNPMPRSSHNEGWVAAIVLDGAADEGCRVWVRVLEVSEGEVAQAVN